MRMLLPIPLLGVLLLMSLTTRADSLLITDALLFVGDASAPVTQDIHIVEGKIEATGADLSALMVDTVIDAGGRPVTPALFAGITAAGLSEIGMVYEAVDSRLSDLYTGLMTQSLTLEEPTTPTQA